MASAKQIAWRKKFARMAKSGKFKSNVKMRKTEIKRHKMSYEERSKKGIGGSMRKYFRELGYTEKQINDYMKMREKQLKGKYLVVRD